LNIPGTVGPDDSQIFEIKKILVLCWVCQLSRAQDVHPFLKFHKSDSQGFHTFSKTIFHSLSTLNGKINTST